MAIITTHKETSFGVGDVIRVHQRVYEADKEKSRVQIFEGTVLAIRGSEAGKSVVVRRIGSQNIGMELIFPLAAPTIEKIEVSKSAHEGSRRAKLYYIREKSKREIDKIYSRAHIKDMAKTEASQPKKKSAGAKQAKKSS